MYYPANWIYATALLMFTINFLVGIDDEFISLAQYENPHVIITKDVFSPPHPLMVGTWTFFLVFFPVVVVYIGLSNLMRDMVALLAMYVVAYITASCMQRFFWTKWYMQPHNVIETFMYDYTHNMYKLSTSTSKIFRDPIQMILAFTFFVMFILLSWTIFMGWYNQSIQSGNWFALVAALSLLVFFALEFGTEPVKLNTKMNNIDEQVPFDIIQFMQVIIVVLCHTALLFGASIDATL
jgi:hypothetical protein